MSEDAAYDVVLRDGSTARIRSAGSDDAAAVRDFLAALSERARWFRFFSGSVDLESAARDAVAPADGRARTPCCASARSRPLTPRSQSSTATPSWPVRPAPSSSMPACGSSRPRRGRLTP
jgi:hypothetical protein